MLTEVSEINGLQLFLVLTTGILLRGGRTAELI